MTKVLARSILRKAERKRLSEIAAFAAAFERYLIEQNGQELEARAAFARRLAEHNAERDDRYEEAELSEVGLTFLDGDDLLD